MLLSKSFSLSNTWIRTTCEKKSNPTGEMTTKIGAGEHKRDQWPGSLKSPIWNGSLINVQVHTYNKICKQTDRQFTKFRKRTNLCDWTIYIIVPLSHGRLEPEIIRIHNHGFNRHPHEYRCNVKTSTPSLLSRRTPRQPWFNRLLVTQDAACFWEFLILIISIPLI